MSYLSVNLQIDVEKQWFPIRKIVGFRSRQSSSSTEATAAAGTLPGHLGVCQAPLKKLIESVDVYLLYMFSVYSYIYI